MGVWGECGVRSAECGVRSAEWWSGGVVEWWSGGVVEWWSGATVRRCDGATVRRCDGATVRRCDGATGGWHLLWRTSGAEGLGLRAACCRSPHRSLLRVPPRRSRLTFPREVSPRASVAIAAAGCGLFKAGLHAVQGRCASEQQQQTPFRSPHSPPFQPTHHSPQGIARGVPTPFSDT
jgi:hypothetical protein